jgi:LL-diaminopimelate aminotransferase
MAQINDNYLKLKAGYLFPEIGRRVAAFAKENPAAKIIRMGIGDVTEPLPPACVEAMHKAVDELAKRETFKGYGPEQGYDFLREAIAKNDFKSRGCDVAADEVFVSDGSKCDCGNILDIFGTGNTIAVTDPVYPVYVDTNVMAGHTRAADERGEYGGLVYLRATAENHFTPDIPKQKVDIIYLCYPNNPTGTVASKATLTKWVEYAKQHESIIFFDAAYEAYITDSSTPHSIYEIPGARDVAIEFRSFSKTGRLHRHALRVHRRTQVAERPSGRQVAGRPVSPVDAPPHDEVQRGELHRPARRGGRVFSGGQGTGREARRLLPREREAHPRRPHEAGLTVYGGVNAPYVWVKTRANASSWQFFDTLLRDANVVCTPGSGFGSAGEGYVRLSAFNSRANVTEALERIAKLGAR